MEFILAKTAGFCWGVRRALNKTLEVDVHHEGKVTTLGPLVHNPQVVELLQYREVRSVDKVEDIDGGLAVIRSHGVSPETYREIEKRADKILDNTCPIVRRVQKTVETYSKRGYFVVIYGESDHPEVIGLIGYAGPGNSTVIRSVEDLEKVGRDKVLLVTQTTTNVQEWKRIMEAAPRIFKEAAVRDTMCDATIERQTDILELCREVDAMIVIGGKNSGNTRRLALIAEKEFNLPTWHIETEEELLNVDFTPYKKIGVTAGASTPSWSIDRVMAYLKTLEDSSRSPMWSRVKRVLTAMVVTNVFTSLSAGALCYVGAVLQGIPFRASFFWLVFFYVLAMHVLNRFTERNIDQFRDDPGRVRFYEKYSPLLKLLGVVSALVAIGISVAMGALPFFFILAASTLGVLYSVRIVPKRWTKVVRYRRLKDIAASKNFFVAAAWAMVSVFPLFSLSATHNLVRTLLTFMFLFLVTVLRSVIVDLTDMNADRLVGRETIPLVLGEEKTALYIKYGAGLLAAMLLFLAGVKIFPGLAWIVGFWTLGELLWFNNSKFKMEKTSVVRRDLLVDSHFLAAGVLALMWTWYF
jgi:(E)-4-hydroxy-3-methyl-but-2-enyl pyrophosphate reductase